MAGIGEQGQRIDLPAVERFDGDESDVQRDADRERAVEVGGCGVVAVAGVLVLVLVPMVFMAMVGRRGSGVVRVR